jgi:hypothetical protein
VREQKAIEDQLRRKEAEIVSLEEKLKAAKIYAKALRDVLKIVGKEEPEESGETKLRKGSLVDQAREVILERGEPVHLDDLLKAMGRDVTRDAKASLNSSLAAYVRNGEIFVRTAPATYGLIELSHTEEEEDEELPPAGFGQDTGDWGSPPRASAGGFADDLDDDIPF